MVFTNMTTDQEYIHKIFSDICKTMQEAEEAGLTDVVESLRQTKITMVQTFLVLYPDLSDIILSYSDN